MENFILKTSLGKGSFGKVKLALNIKDSKLYALKIYKRGVNSDIIEQSIKISKKINHPNLMKCYEHFYNNSKKLVVVLEYIEGENLFDMSKNIDKIKIYFPQIISALRYLHVNDITHRDIKPENILVTKEDKVKIIDYDFLKFVGSGLLSKAGTPLYLSPEIQLAKFYDSKSDIWSLGITLYYCLTRKFPFYEITKERLKDLILSDFEPDYSLIESEKFIKIIKGFLEKKSEKRMTLLESIRIFKE